jgi:hypothetical protein
VLAAYPGTSARLAARLHDRGVWAYRPADALRAVANLDVSAEDTGSDRMFQDVLGGVV